MINVNSLYSGNIVTNTGAAVLYGERWCKISNIRTVIEENAGLGHRAGGIILLMDHGSLINNHSILR